MYINNGSSFNSYFYFILDYLWIFYNNFQLFPIDSFKQIDRFNGIRQQFPIYFPNSVTINFFINKFNVICQEIYDQIRVGQAFQFVRQISVFQG